MNVGRIIQLTDVGVGDGFMDSRTRIGVMQDADIVIDKDGKLLKNRHGATGGLARTELIEKAIQYPEAQDEVDDIVDVLIAMRAHGAALPEIQGALDRYVTERHGDVNGLKLLAAERVRQISVKGYDEGHDAEHTGNELAYEAMARIGVVLDVLNCPGGASSTGNYPMWAYDTTSEERAYYEKVRADPLAELVKAGALIIAEIDRLMRASEK